MVKHCIIIASAYTLGKRIALDYYDEDILQMDVIQKDIDYILKKCGDDVPISTHYISTEKKGWNNVSDKDKFFENIELIKTKEKFCEIILKDRKLKGIDIAKYILTKVPCTHLKLEKLVYMCYADYLCNENKKLFYDKIFAYKLGPVIESVYDEYKKSGKKNIEDDSKIYNKEKFKLPIRSRIISSEDGLQKLVSIDKTIEKYKDFTASELVDITHKELSPWTKSGAGEEQYIEITDELIKKYHKYEII